MGNNAPYAEFDRVGLSRAGSPLFEGLSLRLSEARIGLVGDNGSGKSTFLRLIAGLIRPETGDIRVLGVSTGETRPNIGFLFQNPDHQILFPTVGEEVAFGLIEQGMTAAE